MSVTELSGKVEIIVANLSILKNVKANFNDLIFMAMDNQEANLFFHLINSSGVIAELAGHFSKKIFWRTPELIIGR